jgi:hypothetical protein
MCPACMSSAAIAVAGATSTGIFGAVVLKALAPFKKFRKPPLPIIGESRRYCGGGRTIRIRQQNTPAG